MFPLTEDLKQNCTPFEARIVQVFMFRLRMFLSVYVITEYPIFEEHEVFA